MARHMVADHPNFKVYDPAGEYQAAFKKHEDAAFFAATAFGPGASVRWRHERRRTWTVPADRSYNHDAVWALLCRRFGLANLERTP